jgi:hypothetical protein
VDRREGVVLHEPLVDDDRVLEVVPVERIERDEDVLADRQLALLRRRAVGDDLAGLDLLARLTIGFWFWQVRSFRPTNLRSDVLVGVVDDDPLASA